MIALLLSASQTWSEDIVIIWRAPTIDIIIFSEVLENEKYNLHILVDLVYLLFHAPRPLKIKLANSFLEGCVKFMQNKQSHETSIFSIDEFIMNSLAVNSLFATFMRLPEIMLCCEAKETVEVSSPRGNHST